MLCVFTALMGGFLLGKYGWKTLLFVENFFAMISLVILSFLIKNNYLDYARWVVILYSFTFNISYGPTVGEYLAETMPDKAFGIAISGCWITIILVGFGFPILRAPNVLDTHGVFLLFAGWCLIAGIFIITCIKETKGKTAVEIQKIFSNESNDDLPLTQDDQIRLKYDSF